MSLFTDLKKTETGAKVISSWVGEGGRPVKQLQAELRASVCEGCPENQSPNWWWNNVGPLAEMIRKMLEVKNKLKMRVPNEGKLHVCRACGCCIPLKVFTPIEHIKSHTKTEEYAKLPAHCWVRKEVE